MLANVEEFSVDIEGWSALDVVVFGADVVVKGDFALNVGVAEVFFELVDVAVRSDLLEEIGEGGSAGGTVFCAPEGLIGIDRIDHVPEVALEAGAF